FLAQFSTTCRADALHLALQALRARVEPDRVLACELAWEVHVRGYWRELRRSNGTPYETEEAYFREVLGLASWRTAYKRLAIDPGNLVLVRYTGLQTSAVRPREGERRRGRPRYQGRRVDRNGHRGCRARRPETHHRVSPSGGTV